MTCKPWDLTQWSRKMNCENRGKRTELERVLLGEVIPSQKD